MSEPLLEVRDLVVEFPTRHALLRAIDGVSFGVQRGEVLRFLFQDPTFPRSLLHCLQAVDREIGDLPRNQACRDAVRELQDKILNTKVERIEFRGSLYTLYLRVMHQAGGAMDQRLELDIQVETMEYLKVHTQMELPIHLPPERLLLFKTKSRG